MVLFQSAIFNFQSLLSVILLLICTCAYLRSFFPGIMDRNKTGYVGSIQNLRSSIAATRITITEYYHLEFNLSNISSAWAHRFKYIQKVPIHHILNATKNHSHTVCQNFYWMWEMFAWGCFIVFVITFKCPISFFVFLFLI